MRRPISGMHAAWALVALLVATSLVAFAPHSFGQDNNDNNQAVAGVIVNPDGVLERRVFSDPTGQVMRARVAAARSSLDRDIAEPSRLRMISLPRLEQAIIAADGVITEEMKYLAGLQRIRYVFVYPESGDIVIAGPAEGWVTDMSGRVVGITSGRPVLQLQDLVTALRAYPPQADGAAVIGCSIDPTQEGLVRMQNFLRNTPRVFPAGSQQQTVQYLTTGLQQSLGFQEISIEGVPPDTRFARIMVEADYRMKLMGIGLERPPVRMTTFIERARPSSVAANALVRWYFVPDYQCLRVSEDGSALELVGDGVKLVGENEVVAEGGERRSAGGQNMASKVFTTSFTRSYPQLAARSPVYAELRNLIDMAVVAAYLQKKDIYSDAGWKMEFLGDESKFPVRVHTPPQKVASTVAAVFKGNSLMTPIGGGVHIEPDRALDTDNLLSDEKGSVAELREQVRLNLPDGRWWWD